MKRIAVSLVAAVTMLCSACSSSVDAVYNSNGKISGPSNTYNLNNDVQTIDGQDYEGVMEFGGMGTVWTYDASSEEEIDISYQLSVSEGDAKLVLISPDGTLTTLVENTSQSQQEEIEAVNVKIQKGENRIKLVATDQSKLELLLSAEVGEFHEIGL